MRTKAQQLLGSFQKMDQILGFGISLLPEHLPPKIDTVIGAQMTALNLKRPLLYPGRVDWGRVVRDAAFRVPPFQAGETEKGFRDAVLLETFVQLVEDAPRTRSTCRLALVTGDEQLTIAAKRRVEGFGNAEILSGLEELRNLINTLISTVDEDFVKELREKARELFFVPKDETTFWFRDKVGQKIRDKHGEEIGRVPDGASGRELETVFISPPRFVKKEAQRVHWISVVTYATDAYKFVAKESVLGSASGLGAASNVWSSPLLSAGALASQAPAVGTLGLLGSTPPEKVLVKKGKTEFSVAWSATLDKHHKLTRPQIDDIALVGTTWE